MKNSLKRITALLLVFALAIVFIPAGGPGAAYAGEGEIDASMNGESGVITWEEYPGAAVYDIVINGNYYRSFGPGPGEVNIFNCIDEAYVDGLVKKASEYDIIISALGSDDASIATWSIQVGHEPNVDSLGALNFSSGVLSWDPYPGAEYYVVAAAYFEELTPDGSTAFDLDATMASYGAEPGHYTVRVKAYDDNNKLIAFAKYEGYVYQAKVENPDFAGGSGTAEDPYQIADKYQLDNIRKYPDASFILINDIAFEDADFEEGGYFYNPECFDKSIIGYYNGTFNDEGSYNEGPYTEHGWIPITVFSGELDGNGYSIDNLQLSRFINYVYDENYSLFGLIGRNTGVIKNLFVKECDFLGVSDSILYEGGICGINEGTIENCMVSGNVSVPYAFARAGGITGSNKGIINGCVNLASVFVKKDGPCAGGITCENYGTINNTVNFGSMNGLDWESGSDITGDAGIGGVCYYNASGATIENSYVCCSINSERFQVPTLYNVNHLCFSITDRNSGIIRNVYATTPSVTIPYYKNDGTIENLLILSQKEAFNSESYKNFDFEKDWSVAESGLPYPSGNTIFSDNAPDLNKLFTTVANVQAQPYSYKAIQLTWDKLEDCSSIVVYSNGEVIAELSGDKTSFIEEVGSNNTNKYSYSIVPIWDMSTGAFTGRKSPVSESYVVNTGGGHITPEDTIAPSINGFTVLTSEVYSPGRIEAYIDLEDDSSGIDRIDIVYKDIDEPYKQLILGKSLSGECIVKDTIDFSIESGTKTGQYLPFEIVITDKSGNKQAYSGPFLGANMTTIKDEFDIEFVGVLSNQNVPKELANMDEGKTVVLTIDGPSAGILKKECLDAIKGKDKTLVIYADPDTSLQWVFYGKDIEGETKDLNLGVRLEIVDGETYGATGKVIKVIFADNGELPGTVNFRLKSDYVESIYDLDGSIYVYYEGKNDLVLESTDCPVIQDGSSCWVYFDLTHNSTFIITGEKLDKSEHGSVTDVTRYFGATRYQTAIKAADAYKAQLGIDKFDSVIIACGTNYADALAGSYLSSVKKAPILLVRNTADEIKLVQDYIKANLKSGGMIYMLGGEAVVPEAAITGLSGFKSKRLWGTDRYATNVEILKEAGVSGDEILVASGTGFADSLSASATGKPILLVKNAIQPSQKAFIESLMGKKFYMIGGTGAVSKDIETYFKGLGTVTRIDGATRYDTSANVAKTFFSEPKGAVIAYGANFPDGLCGGSLANAMGGPLLLSANNKSAQAAAYAKANGIKGGAVLGGPTLISDADAKTIFSMPSGTMIKVIS